MNFRRCRVMAAFSVAAEVTVTRYLQHSGSPDDGSIMINGLTEVAADFYDDAYEYSKRFLKLAVFVNGVFKCYLDPIYFKHYAKLIFHISTAGLLTIEGVEADFSSFFFCLSKMCYAPSSDYTRMLKVIIFEEKSDAALRPFNDNATPALKDKEIYYDTATDFEDGEEICSVITRVFQLIKGGFSCT